MVKRIKPVSIIPIMGLKDRLTIGKYQGRSIAYVMGEEPSYIRWLLNTDKVKLNTEAMELYASLAYSQRCDNDFGTDTVAYSEAEAGLDALVRREIHLNRHGV